MSNTLYPPSPSSIPSDLLKLSSSYKWRVAAVMATIFIFVLLYFALLAAAVYICYLCLIWMPGTIGIWTILLKLGSVVFGVMLVLFTLKFLFKKGHSNQPTNIEIKKEDHPELFKFIAELCKETGAPFPGKVFVNEQVNAAVFYRKPILSLIFPVRKSLLIGLGLVNVLNLSEFKAVMAHEFGHFSQRSMKLGSYVYMANRIIHDMVYDRDRWDNILIQWSAQDIRISIFAWILRGVVWFIRSLLGLVYKLINLVHASLSREMEFNADRVAASVTGSNAIVNSLARLMPADQALRISLSQLSTAADHDLYTSDLFFHQNTQEERLFAAADLPTKVAGDAKDFVFIKNEDEVPNMYASHPSNYDRERSVKHFFIPGIEDERSAWLLFSNPEKLREQLTHKVYEVSKIKPAKTAFTPAEEVEHFLQAEEEETKFDAKYHGTYDSRYIHFLDIEPGTKEGLQQYPERADLELAYAELYNDELDAQMKKRSAIQEEQNDLLAQAQKLAGKGQVSFRGATYPLEKINEPLQQTNKELQEQWEGWIKDFDHKVLKVHLAMATSVDADLREAYHERVDFQQKIQDMLGQATGIRQFFHQTVQEVSGAGTLDEAQASMYESTLRNNVRTPFSNMVNQQADIEIPPMLFMEDRPNLRAFLTKNNKYPYADQYLSNEWITQFEQYSAVVEQRLGRIYWKGVARLLQLQEEVYAAWQVEGN